MTKSEVRERLLAGERLDNFLRFVPGQECMIFKADEFRTGPDIVYVPDIDLNEIPVDCDLSSDIEGVFDALDMLYSGDDFIEMCDGDVVLAERLFEYVDWQHPEAVLDAGELDEDM